MPNQPDDAIDKVLAALRDAPNPEGMNARIAARLEQTHLRPASHWRALFTGQSLAAAWFRGALTGAVAAALAIAAVLAFHNTSMPKQTTARNTPAQNPAHAVLPVAGSRAPLCPSPAMLRVHQAAPPPARPTLLAEARVDATAPSHPAPPLPLTAQERELVRIARIADPKTLATINPETEAKLQAQESAEFEKFFAPPAAPPATQPHE